MATPTLRSLFTRLSLTPSTSAISCSTLSATTPAISSLSNSFHQTQCRQTRSFHMSPAREAKAGSSAKGGKKGGKKKRRGKGNEGPDPRIVNLKVSMPRSVPAPLRFARNRALRHWTIHRAWLLYQRKERERQEHELQRMYQSMHNACEELRKTNGPGTRDEGYLYRVAMEKHGMYGHGAVPIEYARPQTETPARQAWNHEWTR